MSKYTLNEFLHYRSLAFKLENQHTYGVAFDDVIQAAENIPGKQVCTTLSNPLIERLENTLSILSMTKRQFIELAIIEALENADDIMAMHDVHNEGGEKQ